MARTRTSPAAGSRRALLGAAVALPLAAHSLPALATRPAPEADPDAELIALCAAFDALERQYLALFDGPAALEDGDQRDAAIAAIQAAQAPLLQRICALHATTRAGLLARMQTMMLDNQQLRPDRMLQSGYTDRQLLGAFLRDVIDHAGGAPSLHGGAA